MPSESGSMGTEGDGSLRARLQSSVRVPSAFLETKPFAVLCLILAIGVFVHFRCLLQGYTADDYDLFVAIERDSFSIWDPFPAGRGTYFRPAVMGSLFVERRLDAGPFAHHAVNLALHFTSAILLFSVLRVLGGGIGIASCLTGLFVVHRASIPAAFWISGRGESLLTVGILAALLSSVILAKNGCRSRWVVVFLASIVLSLCSKESAVVLPLLLVAIFSRIRRSERTGVVRNLIWTSVMTTLAYSVYLSLRFYGRSGAPEIAPPIATLRGMSRSIVLALVPISEWTLYLAPFAGICTAGAIIAIGIYVTGLRTSLGVFLPPVLLFTIALTPILLVQGGSGVRQLYLPIAMACIGLVIGLCQFPELSRKFSWMIAALTFAFVISSTSAAKVWERNGAIARKCCSDFRRLTHSSTGTIILLTTPRSIGDAPVFSNDTRAALHHCVTGKFGYESRILSVAESVMRIPESPSRFLSPPNSFARKLDPFKGWFVHPRQSSSTVGMLSILEPGRFESESQAFSFSMSRIDGRRAHPEVLEFNGGGFSRVNSENCVPK